MSKGASRGVRAGGVGVIVMAVVVAVVSLSYVIGFQRQHLKRIAVEPPFVGTQYTVDSGKRLIPLSLGYRLPMTDFLWMRSIQSFGGMWRSTRKYDAMFNLFFVMTDLDPRFIEAYKFGSLVIGDEGGDQERGIELLEKGVYKNPKNWRIPYEAAYCLLYSMDDNEENLKRATYFLTRCLKDPECPEYVIRLLNEIKSRSGHHDTAARQIMGPYLEALDKGDPIYIGINRRRLLAIVHRWQVDMLYKGSAEFAAVNGRPIKSVDELLDSGYSFEAFDVFRLDQVTEFYRRQDAALAPNLDEIYRVCFTTRSSANPPIDPRVLDDAKRVGETPGYHVVKGVEPTERHDFIASVDDIKADIQAYLRRVRFRLNEYWEATGKLPATVVEALPTGLTVDAEPMGGEWVYEPELMDEGSTEFVNGVFRSSTFPDL